MLYPNEKQPPSTFGIVPRARRHYRPLAAIACLILLFLSFSRTSTSPFRSHIKVSETNNGLTYTPATQPTTGLIPRNIYQVFFYNDADESMLNHMDSWIHTNPDCSYTRLSRSGALEFVREHYADRPDIVKLYSDLAVPVLNSDMLRYLILQAHGGIYADVDVSALQPLRKWVPKHFRKRAAVIVGIEYDRMNDAEMSPGFWLDLQFATWTVAAAPGHPMLQLAIETIASRIYALAEKQGCALEDLEPTDDQILQTTGPAVWSKVVFDSLSLAAGKTITPADLTMMEEPRLFGDILVLPIDGFTGNVPHSGAGRHPEQQLISHGFHGSWRGSGSEDNTVDE